MKNIKTNEYRITVTILSLLLLLTAGPFFFTGEFTSYAATRNASTWAELLEAVENAGNVDTITITDDIEIKADHDGNPDTAPLPTTLTIEDKDITIVGAAGGVKIKRETLPKTGNSAGPTTDYDLEAMIKVVSGKLTLGDNLTFSGERGARSTDTNLNYWFNNDFKEGTKGFFVQVENDGTLVLGEEVGSAGPVFEDYSTTWSQENNKDFIPAGISPIYIAGNFTMNSGEIRDNLVGSVKKGVNDAPGVGFCGTNSFLTHPGGGQAELNGADNVIASGSDWTVSQTTAGGIFIDAPDKELAINGGTITRNKGNTGGIAVAGGSLTIKGGTISNGFGDHFAGGLYIVSDDAEVRMCGGVIENCESNMGGGVLPTNNASFFLMGGTITNNKSYINGGGVLVYSDRVYLLSGVISNNASSTFGGGVYVYGNDKNIEQQYVMTLHNAQITGNQAVGSVNDPRIRGTDQAARVNTSADTFLSGSGGGVWLCPAGVSEFDASTLNIYENSAVMQGDDFHKDAGFDGGILLDFGPHDELDEWEHQELEGPKGKYVDSEKKKNKQKLTVPEATSGSNGSISLVHLDNTPNPANSLLRVENNVSLRGGGIGSNGVVIFSKDAKDRNIDKGELEFKKTFTDLPEKPMEYEMIAADENGNPKKDSNGKDAVIMTFRLFDANYSSNYDELRVNPNAKEFGQLSAKWNDDKSKVTIQFPEGNDDISFFKGDEMQEGDELKVIFREYEVSNNKRGKQVSERVFSFDTPEFQEAETLVDRKIDIYPGGHCTQSSDQGCDEWSCDPGDEPEEFDLRYRTYKFKSDAENKEPIEIEKYVNQAVHADVELYDVFSYDILAYVSQNADEVTITDKLDDQLEFAPTNGNVKVYDLGETVDDKGNRELIDSNHLPVYDVSGNEIDNGDVIPSVKQGKEIDKSKYTVSTANKTLRVVIKNTIGDDGKPVKGKPQNATPLRGHYVRIRFDAQISNEKQEAIENGSMKYNDFEKMTVYPEEADAERDEPNKGNDPVKSKEEHSGIANKASYTIKVGNEARYNDTSNTVTVKPEEPGPQVEKYVNKDVHKDIAVDDEFTYDIMVYVPENADSVKITDRLNEQLEFVSTEEEIASSAVVKKRNNHKVNGTVKKNNGTPIEATAAIDGQKLTVEVDDAKSARCKYIQISFKCKLVKDIEYEYVTVTDNGDVTGGADTHKGVPNTGRYQYKFGNEWSSEFDSNTVTVKVEEENQGGDEGDDDDDNDVAPDNDGVDEKVNKDDKAKGVNTGDESKVMPWIMMLIASVAAVCTGVVYRRKRSR